MKLKACKKKWHSKMKAMLILGSLLLLSGCVPKVEIPVVDHFDIKTDMRSGHIDPVVYEEQLFSDLYTLMKSNEGVKVPICEASRELKQCVESGYSVFVWGGVIPGVGKRNYYLFSNISLGKDRIEFSKDNSDTTFIGTPMYTKENVGHIYVKNGGLQVEMAKYYANWAGVGNMTMAEGWAIDYIDFDGGIVGLQLELNISGPLVLGGGSKYVLFKFPNLPDTLSLSKSTYDFLE
jgi:hypothetical protein